MVMHDVSIGLLLICVCLGQCYHRLWKFLSCIHLIYNRMRISKMVVLNGWLWMPLLFLLLLLLWWSLMWVILLFSLFLGFCSVNILNCSKKLKYVSPVLDDKNATAKQNETEQGKKKKIKAQKLPLEITTLLVSVKSKIRLLCNHRF